MNANAIDDVKDTANTAQAVSNRKMMTGWKFVWVCDWELCLNYLHLERWRRNFSLATVVHSASKSCYVLVNGIILLDMLL